LEDEEKMHLVEISSAGASDKNESVGWRSTDGRRTMRETTHVILMIPVII